MHRVSLPRTSVYYQITAKYSIRTDQLNKLVDEIFYDIRGGSVEKKIIVNFNISKQFFIFRRGNCSFLNAEEP